jgi:hypothetical protein
MQRSTVGSKVLYCLEEVVWSTSADHGLAGSWAGVKLQAVDKVQ